MEHAPNTSSYPLLPFQSQLEHSKAKSIEGPKSFVNIIAKAENHQNIQAGITA